MRFGFSAVFSTVVWGLSVLTLTASFSVFSPAYAKKKKISQEIISQTQNYPAGQRTLIQAQMARKGMDWVEVQNARVVEILPDDTKGRAHQKWVFEVASGGRVVAIYNSDVAHRVDVQVGDVMSAGGQYIWDKEGGLLHWLHEDPRNRRPDGYVLIDGVRYGEFTADDGKKRK